MVILHTNNAYIADANTNHQQDITTIFFQEIKIKIIAVYISLDKKNLLAEMWTQRMPYDMNTYRIMSTYAR